MRPNISPGKRNENSDKTDVKEEDKKPSAQPQPQSSQPADKPSGKPEEPKVNIIQVRFILFTHFDLQHVSYVLSMILGEKEAVDTNPKTKGNGQARGTQS